MNIPSAPYHAGLSQADRNQAHRQFVNDQVQVNLTLHNTCERVIQTRRARDLRGWGGGGGEGERAQDIYFLSLS